MLSQLKPINDRRVVNTNVEHSALGIQESVNVLHNNWDNVVVNDVPKVFELVMSIFNNGKLLSQLKIVVLHIMVLSLNHLRNLTLALHLSLLVLNHTHFHHLIIHLTLRLFIHL